MKSTTSRAVRLLIASAYLHLVPGPSAWAAIAKGGPGSGSVRPVSLAVTSAASIRPVAEGALHRYAAELRLAPVAAARTAAAGATNARELARETLRAAESDVKAARAKASEARAENRAAVQAVRSVGTLSDGEAPADDVEGAVAEGSRAFDQAVKRLGDSAQAVAATQEGLAAASDAVAASRVKLAESRAGERAARRALTDAKVGAGLALKLPAPARSFLRSVMDVLMSAVDFISKERRRLAAVATASIGTTLLWSSLGFGPFVALGVASAVYFALTPGDARAALSGAGAWIKDIKKLPRSFTLFFGGGWVAMALGQEIQAAAMPIFSMNALSLSDALWMGIVGLIMRPVGAWLGAYIQDRFVTNPTNKDGSRKTLTAKQSRQRIIMLQVIGILLLALSPLPIIIPFIPALAGWMTAAGIPFMSVHAAFYFFAALSGLTYGFLRGVGEKVIMMGIAPDKSVLERGANFAYMMVEAACIFGSGVLATMLLRAAIPTGTTFMGIGLVAMPAGVPLVLVTAAVTALSALFYLFIRFHKEDAPAQAEERVEMKVSPLQFMKDNWRDYAPAVFFRTVHFLMYTAFGLLLVVLFSSGLGIMTPLAAEAIAGKLLSWYAFGSMAASFVMTGHLAQKLSVKNATLLGTIVTMLFTAAIIAQMFVAPTSLLWPIILLGSVLGGLVTAIGNKIDAHLAEKATAAAGGHRGGRQLIAELAKWLMTISIAAVLPLMLLAQFMPVLLAAPVVAGVVLLGAVAIAMVALRAGPFKERPAAPAPAE